MFLVAVTGGIASGKSTVSRMFADLNCPVIDADLIAREGRPLRTSCNVITVCQHSGLYFF